MNWSEVPDDVIIELALNAAKVEIQVSLNSQERMGLLVTGTKMSLDIVKEALKRLNKTP